jgi:hypothetical protein
MVKYFNSFWKEPSPSPRHREMMEKFVAMHRVELGLDATTPLLHVCQSCQQQVDGNNCGVYLLHNVSYVWRSLDPSQFTVHLYYLRHKFGVALLRSSKMDHEEMEKLLKEYADAYVQDMYVREKADNVNTRKIFKIFMSEMSATTGIPLNSSASSSLGAAEFSPPNYRSKLASSVYPEQSQSGPPPVPSRTTSGHGKPCCFLIRQPTPENPLRNRTKCEHSYTEI